MIKGAFVKFRAIGLFAALALWCMGAAAQGAPPQDSAPDPRATLASQLKPQAGTIKLPGGLASLNLTDSFRYLTPHDAKRLLEEGWGNPPNPEDSTLGMIVPANIDPLAREGWGVLITYNSDGHVSDEDAAKIDYTDLLQKMKGGLAELNTERSKQGYPSLTLAGWAEPPHYDAASHKMYWAKDLIVGNNQVHTLNYFVRVLGRQGVLELNAIAGMDQLALIRESMKQVEAFSDFTEGNRYAQFDSSTDKLAAYGLAALVAGGVAAKTGLLAKLFVMLVALKKFILIGFAAVAGLFGKFFKKKPPSAGGPGSYGGPR